MKFIHKTIINHANKILYNPNSLRSRLIILKLSLENNSIEKSITWNNLELFDYLGIYDLDSLKSKVHHALKYME
uniref:Putative ankyrin repeat protein n=1 Tax=Moumouvirus sp. 'Monve' TaxID=1128131 RepID=H2ED73_9VIRU|nr:putative ankyrin repeat protein [Moumouvirus Monve]